jgi:cytochrome c-type biogenesis protein CcmH
MVARYGDFVLYRPPFKLSTLLLWLGPVLLALIALLILGRTVRARRARPVPVPLTTAERDEATRLLENGKSGDHR